MKTHPSPSTLRLALAAAVALGALLLPAAAFGSGVIVIVGGDADGETRGKLAAAVEERLVEHREEPRRLSLPAAELEALVECVSRESSKECAADFMRTRSDGATRAIVLSVARPDHGGATITGWVLAQDGAILVIDQGVCDACTPATLEEVTRDLLAALLREVEARTAPTILAVRTTPPGAQVEIDGRAIGESAAEKALEYRVYAGAHRIAIQLRGYQPAIRAVQVGSGETKPVEVELVPLQTSTPLDPSASASDQGAAAPCYRARCGAWVTVGAGAALAAAGVALVLLDQDAFQTPGAPRPYDRRETMTLGVASVSLGAAVIGAGLWWLHETTRAPRAPAAVQTAPGGAVLLYTGAF